MKALYLLFLLAVCEGLAIDKANTQVHLQAPKLRGLFTEDDPNNITSHTIIHFTGVESDDEQDPVIGYKLKVWEVKKIKKKVFKNQGDKFVEVEKEIYPRIDANVIPDGVPKEFLIPANETSTTFHDVYVDVAYQFAILAFTAKGEGPLSAPVRIRLHPRDE